jgi:hypothetical protein
LARIYRRDQRAAYKALPQGEKLFLQALATVDVGDLIRTLESVSGRAQSAAADQPGRPVC